MSGWLDLPRVPEPEVMDDSGEVDAYSDSAARDFLSSLDDTFVDHALRLLGRSAAVPGVGKALDIGSGPGQIVWKLSRHLPGWQFIGVDRSPGMIGEARAGNNGRASNERRAGCVNFFLADGNRLPFADATFDLVVSNSVLHHLQRPEGLFAEIARVARPDAAILVRDLRRPSRVAYPMHVRWHGRHYSGLMYKLYCDSVRAAYTPQELTTLLRQSPLSGAHVFTRGRTHLGLERAARLRNATDGLASK